MAISYGVIGRHIRTARKAQKLTQEQVAEALKMSVAHYGRLERGERVINLERLSQISVLLSTPMEQLVQGCTPSIAFMTTDESLETAFVTEMRQYTTLCKEATLARMLRVCAALASEDIHQ